MKNLAKLITLLAFVLIAGSSVLISSCASQDGSSLLSQVAATPTPGNANIPANVAVNAAPPAASAPGDVPDQVLGQSIKKKFVLSKDSLSEYGESPFDHETHALLKYSPDGKSVVGCVECHHTDQPKSSLKPPLVTSERDVVLTLDTWKTSKQKVSECRACHFQDGLVPDGKEMPTASYTDGGKTTVKDLNNELAYHINCNTCHDAAFKLRPELKQKKGFATSKDCTICHKPN
jgi:Zn ribbon nucleic-acid-binding protein